MFGAVLGIQIFFLVCEKSANTPFFRTLSIEIDEIVQAFEVNPFTNNHICCFVKSFLCACICLPRGPVH